MSTPSRWAVGVTLGVLVGAAGAFAIYRAFPQSSAATFAGAGPQGEPFSGTGPQGEPGAPSTLVSGPATEPGAPEAQDAGSDAEGDGDAPDEPEPKSLSEQRERLYAVLLAEGVTADEVQKIRAIFEASPELGQGNPAVAVHPMSRAECRRRRAAVGVVPGNVSCGKKHMVPIYDPSAGETADSAKVCIDQYEFPGIPCEYPVVHVRANEAEAICRAAGKRLCDAHEWEGACAGAVRSPDVEYSFKHDRQYSSGMHNLKREIVWAYGPKKNHALCGTTSFKTKDCPGGGWKQCGSNTFPAGAFPECKSPFGVYDQHGNAAEHMNLPTKAEEMMSAGKAGGLTEMKGSWFIFAKGEPHLDDCRWREPSWHESKVSDPNSHKNYHLGFRCCRDR